MKVSVQSLVVAIALVLLSSTTGLAQTHPCDQPPASGTVVQAGAPHKAQFCAVQGDAIEAAIGYVDGVEFSAITILQKTATPNAIGLVLFETSAFIQVSRGNHALTVRVCNRSQFTGVLQCGAQADPFPFGAADDTPPPAPPLIKGLSR
jgi:hypothetical protein